MKALILTIFISIFVIFSSYASISDNLPSEIKEAVIDARKTKNQYVVKSVIDNVKKDHPSYSKMIDSFTVLLDKKNAEEEGEKFSGGVDSWLKLASGNTNTKYFSLSSKLDYEGDDWSNTLKMLTRSGEENNVRTSEEYLVNNQSKYKLSPKNYGFLEFEYVKDTFSGYEYRFSELVGLGHKFYENPEFSLAGEFSVGARQSLLTDDNNENSLLGKVSVKAVWNLSKSTTLEQEFSSAVGADATITASDTSIKIKIVKSIYLKLNHNVQHISDVADGAKNTDKLTSFGVGYEF